ncbi:hypothetical protein NDU88_004360 [Pleurodeles waltl]|uniref:Uncharacterized protein n=1 Tax=Pleurodeles waltl TaxID=8319 RepID=A0AAV7T856_PLEWA|nr:hypothetical protein NDU88_004360 [Pleurodeles waltl]
MESRMCSPGGRGTSSDFFEDLMLYREANEARGCGSCPGIFKELVARHMAADGGGCRSCPGMLEVVTEQLMGAEGGAGINIPEEKSMRLVATDGAGDSIWPGIHEEGAVRQTVMHGCRSCPGILEAVSEFQVNHERLGSILVEEMIARQVASHCFSSSRNLEEGVVHKLTTDIAGCSSCPSILEMHEIQHSHADSAECRSCPGILEAVVAQQMAADRAGCRSCPGFFEGMSVRQMPSEAGDSVTEESRMPQMSSDTGVSTGFQGMIDEIVMHSVVSSGKAAESPLHTAAQRNRRYTLRPSRPVPQDAAFTKSATQIAALRQNTLRLKRLTGRYTLRLKWLTSRHTLRLCRPAPHDGAFTKGASQTAALGKTAGN